jgi:hypothetical protein
MFCLNISPKFQYPESEIKDSLETVKDPFDNSESVSLVRIAEQLREGTIKNYILFRLIHRSVK